MQAAGNMATLLEGEGADVGCLHPAHAAFRYVILFCSCMLTFGSYFCFDMPSTMKEGLQDTYIRPWAPTSGLFQTDFLYGLFYSLYAWTNALVGCMFGGIIVDRYGTHVGCAVFCALYTIGQIVFAAGASLHMAGPEFQYCLMLLGRFIFGMGGGSITLVQNTISAQFFRHDRMSLAMGFTLTASRLGSVINLNFTEQIVQATSIATTLWLGVVFCCFGAFFGFCYVLLDRRHKRYTESLGQQISIVQVKKVSMRDIGRLPARLWILSCIISTYYICIFAFIAVAKDFFEAKWHGTSVAQGASFRSSIVYLMSMVFTVFVGAFIDWCGRRAQIQLVTCLLSIPVFLIFLLTRLDPIVPMLLLGVTYMFAASSLWPCIPLVVPMELNGTANGMATSVQMIGIALANMLVGVLQDANPEVYPGTQVKRYDYCLMFFIACGTLASLFSLALNVLDARSGGELNGGKPALAAAPPTGVSLEPTSEERPSPPPLLR